MHTNHVRFARGSLASYLALPNKDRNTLYCITDENNSGRLYLGDMLICGGILNTPANLAELSDVLIANNLKDKDFLVYNAITKKWVNQSIEEILNIIVDVMVGATDEANGVAGLVPAPTKNDVNKFLRGDGQWAEVFSENEKTALEGIPTLAATVSNLQSTLGTLIGNEEEDINKSIRDITVGVLTDYLVNADGDESLDTLQEVADWIKSHPQDAAALNSELQATKSKVESLESILLDKEENKTDEETGEEISITTLGLVSKVGNIEDLLTQQVLNVETLETIVDDATKDIDAILEILTWKELEGQEETE